MWLDHLNFELSNNHSYKFLYNRRMLSNSFEEKI